jgi:plasmid stability protein
MKALTIRGVDRELARALEREKRRRGDSLNHTVLELLRQALGVGADATRSNGLGKLAGTWSQEELEAFAEATSLFERVDDELWS